MVVNIVAIKLKGMMKQGVLDKIRGVDTDVQPWILQ